MSKNKLKVGDVVREKGGGKIGIVRHRMSFDDDLVVISFPPQQEGFCYIRDDLTLVSKGRKS
jgi:hypothetical protein